MDEKDLALIDEKVQSLNAALRNELAAWEAYAANPHLSQLEHEYKIAVIERRTTETEIELVTATLHSQAREDRTAGPNWAELERQEAQEANSGSDPLPAGLNSVSLKQAAERNAV